MLVSRVKVVGLDWNGFLLDDARHLFEHGVCHIFEVLGVEKTDFDTYITSLQGGDYIQFYRDHGITESDDRLNEIMQEGLDKVGRPELFPGARDFLELVSGELPLVLVSRRDEPALLDDLSHYGLTDYFEIIRGGITDKEKVLFEIVEELDIAQREIFYGGDVVDDIRAINSVGGVSCAKPGGFNVRSDLLAEYPDIFVESFIELQHAFTQKAG